MRRIERGTARHAAYLAFVSGASRAPSFLIPLLIAALFGSGTYTDTYFLAYSAVLFVGGTLGQAIEVAMVPFAARVIRETAGAVHGYLLRAAEESVLWGVGIWLCVMGFLLVSAQQDTRGQLGVYALAFAPFALCWAATGVYTGALISQWEIAVATGSVLWRGAGALAGFVGGVLGGGLVSVAVGISAGEAARLWWLKRRTRRQIQDPPRGVPEGPAALRQAAGAQVLASIAGSAVLVVERLMARTLGPGNISHLEYATRLLVIPTLFFDGGLAPLLLARWTNRLTGGSDELHQQEVWRPLMKGVLLALGCGALLALLAPTFVAIVLRHGRFSAADASAVAVLLRVLAIGFVGSMGATLLERLFLAGSRNRTLAMLSVIRAVSRVGVAFALLGAKGLLAFGVGYSASEWLYFAILIYLTRTGRAAGTAFRIA